MRDGFIAGRPHETAQGTARAGNKMGGVGHPERLHGIVRGGARRGSREDGF